MGVNFSDLIFIIAWIAERENCERNRKKRALFMRIDDKKRPCQGGQRRRENTGFSG
jgi:hypothetical protein